MRYQEEIAYNFYLIEMAQNNLAVSNNIDALLAISENNTSELISISEGFKDSIKKLWQKIKDFISRMWQKFFQRMSSWIENDKDYLARYKDVILNKKPDDVPVTMIPHSNGIENITKIKIKPYQDNVVPEEVEDLAYKKSVIAGKVGMQDITVDDSWKQYTHNLFLGGVNEVEVSMTTLNMTDLFNFCADFTKIKNTIENDKKTLESECDKLASSLETSATKADQAADAAANDKKSAQQPAAQTSDNSNTTGNGGDNNNSSTTSTQPQQTSNTEAVDNSASIVIGDIGNKVLLLELEIGKSSSGSGTSTGQKNSNGVSTSNTQGNADMTTNSKTKASAATSSIQKNVDGTANVKGDFDKAKENEKNAAEEFKVLKNKANVYRTINVDLLTSKLTASEEIYKDYMKIIKYHVSNKVGKKDADEQSAQAGTNYTGNTDVSMLDPDSISKYENQSDEGEKKKAAGELWNNFISKNPNFKGNLDDAIKIAKSVNEKKNQQNNQQASK